MDLEIRTCRPRTIYCYGDRLASGHTQVLAAYSIPPLLNDIGIDKPYKVTREQQLLDVRLRLLIERLESDTTPISVRTTSLRDCGQWSEVY